MSALDLRRKRELVTFAAVSLIASAVFILLTQLLVRFLAGEPEDSRVPAAMRRCGAWSLSESRQSRSQCAPGAAPIAPSWNRWLESTGSRHS